MPVTHVVKDPWLTNITYSGHRSLTHIILSRISGRMLILGLYGTTIREIVGGGGRPRDNKLPVHYYVLIFQWMHFNRTATQQPQFYLFATNVSDNDNLPALVLVLFYPITRPYSPFIRNRGAKPALGWQSGWQPRIKENGSNINLNGSGPGLTTTTTTTIVVQQGENENRDENGTHLKI